MAYFKHKNGYAVLPMVGVTFRDNHPTEVTEDTVLEYLRAHKDVTEVHSNGKPVELFELLFDKPEDAEAKQGEANLIIDPEEVTPKEKPKKAPKKRLKRKK